MSQKAVLLPLNGSWVKKQDYYIYVINAHRLSSGCRPWVKELHLSIIILKHELNANVSSWIFIMWMSDDYAKPAPEAHVGRHRVTIWRTLISKTLVGGQTKPRRQNITRPELCNRSLQVHRRPLLLKQTKTLYLSSSFTLLDNKKRTLYRHELLNFLVVGKV